MPPQPEPNTPTPPPAGVTNAPIKKDRLPVRRTTPVDNKLTKLRPWLIGGAFLVALYLALNPSIGYAPVPRVVLFFVLALLFTLVSVGELDAKFEMRLPGFLFTSTGVLAAMCGLLWLLNHLAAAEVQATRFTLRYKGVHKLTFTPSMISVTPLQGIGGSMPYFIDGEDIYLIYPLGVNTAQVRVNPVGLKWYHKELSYAGNRQVVQQIDTDFSEE